MALEPAALSRGAGPARLEPPFLGSPHGACLHQGWVTRALGSASPNPASSHSRRLARVLCHSPTCLLAPEPQQHSTVGRERTYRWVTLAA